jgi:hypothetical protein
LWDGEWGGGGLGEGVRDSGEESGGLVGELVRICAGGGGVRDEEGCGVGDEAWYTSVMWRKCSMARCQYALWCWARSSSRSSVSDVSMISSSSMLSKVRTRDRTCHNHVYRQKVVVVAALRTLRIAS